MIFCQSLTLIQYILKKNNLILLLMFSSTYIIPNMKALPFLFQRKSVKKFFKTNIQLRTDFVVLPVVSPTLPYCSIIVRVGQHQCSVLVASLEEGTRYHEFKTLSAEWTSSGSTQCFSSFSRNGLLLMPLSFKSFPGAALQIQIQEVFEFYVKGI